MIEELNKDKIIEEYKIKEKKYKLEKRILLLIIIFLIIICLVSFRIGKIEEIKTDYKEVVENDNPVDKEIIAEENIDEETEDEENIDKDYKTAKDKKANSNNQTNQGNNSNGNNNSGGNGDTDNIKLVKVSWNGKEVTKNTQLDIFKNEKFDGQKIIAPGSKGSSTFCIENNSNTEMLCDLKFEEQTEYLINMKYRLKIDNKYVVGNSNKYENLEKLNLEDIIMSKKSINMYTIEWYWDDSDINDTEVATQTDPQYYTLNFEVSAEQYIK